MKRRPLLHVINFLLPILFFLSLDLSSYFISDHRSEKMGFKVTVLLAISVLLLILNEILPAMSNKTPLIGSYPILNSNVVSSLLLIPAVSVSSSSQPPTVSWSLDWCCWVFWKPYWSRTSWTKIKCCRGNSGSRSRRRSAPTSRRPVSLHNLFSTSWRSVQPFNFPLISEKAKKTLCWCICNAYEGEKQDDVLFEAEEVKSCSHYWYIIIRNGQLTANMAACQFFQWSLPVLQIKIPESKKQFPKNCNTNVNIGKTVNRLPFSIFVFDII